jgi:hypothetical protein
MTGKPRQPPSEPRSKKNPLENQQVGLAVVNSGQASTRQTPYQRIRERLDARSTLDATQAITTVDSKKTDGNLFYAHILTFLCSGLHAHIRSDPRSDQVAIRKKLLWVSCHQHKQLKFIRLHFIDADAQEPLEKLLGVRCCLSAFIGEDYLTQVIAGTPRPVRR